ncbi:uncharacterized protein JCM15063_002577 [Sporobolomyces koalae]|uniref:uncharacterized protein n=1 Tax=Sporobolomyces koalae TaxID=500713 RepID=UPI00317E76E6
MTDVAPTLVPLASSPRSHALTASSEPAMPRPPPSALTPSPSQPLPPTTTTSTPSIPSSSSAAAANPASPPPFPALHLIPLNNTFVPKQVSLDPPGHKVKIGRQTNAKTVPNGTNGYFDSKVLSRAHAEVWSEDLKVFIKDVKSSNGTFINGERLSPESAESDIFELHTDDVVEFGIDILTDDTKTIVHHKVAAKVHLVMNPDDALASSREFNNWYRQAGEQGLQQHQQQQHHQQQQPGGGAQQQQGTQIGGQNFGGPSGPGGVSANSAGTGAIARRPARAPINAQNGLSFEHVLSRLQGELQKSRDTGSNLTDVNSTLCDVHDTLGGGTGGAPPPRTMLNGGPMPYPTTSAFPPRPPPGATNESVQQLQQQLNDLATHVGRIRDLESMLKEQEGVREEVENLRRLMLEEHERREEKDRERSNGRESPVARMLEREERDDEQHHQQGHVEDDDDDVASVASVETVVAEESSPPPEPHVNGTPAAPLDPDQHTTSEPHASSTLNTSSTKGHEEFARERLVLQEQNVALHARLDALSAELDEAIQLGRSLQTQHSEAAATIKLLEHKIATLETTVEARVEAAQSKVMRECEERWKGWRDVFEEGWKREKEGWREEREKLWQVVKEWEDKKKQQQQQQRNVENDDSEDDEDEDADEQERNRENRPAHEGATEAISSLNRSPSSSSSPSRKRATRRRKRTTIVPTPATPSPASSESSIPNLSHTLASTLGAHEQLASDSDSTIGGGGRASGGQASKSGRSGGTSHEGPPAARLHSLASQIHPVLLEIESTDTFIARHAQPQHGLPVSWAGAVVVVAVAVGYGAALKLKE